MSGCLIHFLMMIRCFSFVYFVAWSFFVWFSEIEEAPAAESRDLEGLFVSCALSLFAYSIVHLFPADEEGKQENVWHETGLHRILSHEPQPSSWLCLIASASFLFAPGRQGVAAVRLFHFAHFPSSLTVCAQKQTFLSWSDIDDTNEDGGWLFWFVQFLWWWWFSKEKVHIFLQARLRDFFSPFLGEEHTGLIKKLRHRNSLFDTVSTEERRGRGRGLRGNNWGRWWRKRRFSFVKIKVYWGWHRGMIERNWMGGITRFPLWGENDKDETERESYQGAMQRTFLGRVSITKFLSVM